MSVDLRWSIYSLSPLHLAKANSLRWDTAIGNQYSFIHIPKLINCHQSLKRCLLPGEFVEKSRHFLGAQASFLLCWPCAGKHPDSGQFTPGPADCQPWHVELRTTPWPRPRPPPSNPFSTDLMALVLQARSYRTVAPAYIDHPALISYFHWLEPSTRIVHSSPNSKPCLSCWRFPAPRATQYLKGAMSYLSSHSH